MPRTGGCAGEADHLLTDVAAERKWNFSLQRALQRSRERPLLRGVVCLATAHTQPDPAALAEIVRSCGGQVRCGGPVACVFARALARTHDQPVLWGGRPLTAHQTVRNVGELPATGLIIAADEDRSSVTSSHRVISVETFLAGVLSQELATTAEKAADTGAVNPHAPAEPTRRAARRA